MRYPVRFGEGLGDWVGSRRDIIAICLAAFWGISSGSMARTYPRDYHPRSGRWLGGGDFRICRVHSAIGSVKRREEEDY